MGLTLATLAQTTDLDVTVRTLTRQQPPPGLTVYLENPAIGLKQSAQTDANGKVLFRQLPLNGTYRLFTKEADEYGESAADGLVLRANFRRSVTLLLPIKREVNLTAVDVRGSSARGTSATRINTTNAEVSSEQSGNGLLRRSAQREHQRSQ